MKKCVEKRKSFGGNSCHRERSRMESASANASGITRKSSLFIQNFVSSNKGLILRRNSLSSLVLGSHSFGTDRAPVFTELLRTDSLDLSIKDYIPFTNTLITDSPVFCDRRSSLAPSPCMGRAMRVIVTGAKKVGKTAILRQVACMEDITSQAYSPTLDDTYQVLLEEGDRPRENLIFHDTGGIADYGQVEMKKPYLQVADAFVLVYSVTDHESFNRVDLLKKYIEKQFGKEKKEVPIVVLGNMKDAPGRKVDKEFAHAWANREKVRLFEVTATDRSTLVDFVQYLGMRHFHPSKESKFSLSKKLKSEKSNAAIVMDF